MYMRDYIHEGGEITSSIAGKKAGRTLALLIYGLIWLLFKIDKL